VEQLQQEKTWRWVKIARQDVNQGRFPAFEEVSEEEIEMAEASCQFYQEGTTRAAERMERPTPGAISCPIDMGITSTTKPARKLVDLHL
jgi:phosphodiesterase/alkaline phosphatase D-like protein